MLLKRFYHEGLAQASYLLGCQQTGEALIIDANRDTKPYLAALKAEGMKLVAVTETHIHADYLSGSRELAAATGAQLLLSGMGTPEWQYAFASSDGARLLRDGDEIRIGRLRLDVWHTPGHTPEHLAFVCTDLPASEHPVGVFTGDFIFVGDVGRPDLLERAANVAGTMRAGAEQLFDSIQRFTARYPDYLQIWPGHGSGSACGKSLGALPSSSLGYERVSNWALRTTDRTTFVEMVLAGQPDPPVYFAIMKRLNKEGPRVLHEPPAARHCPPSDLPRVVQEGARVVDLRHRARHAAGHPAGVVSIPLNRSFVGWAGWLLPYDREFYLLHDDPSAIPNALCELSLIGLDNCGGWFGADAMSAVPDTTVPQVTPAALARENGHVQVVDVRSEDEYAAGHLPGARHIPLGRLESRLSGIDLSRPVVLACETGSRSSIGCSLLQARGATAVRNLEGGFTGWAAEGLPVER